jgi:hypothetical protein
MLGRHQVGARSAGSKPRLAFEGDDFRTVLGLVAHELGVALLPGLALTDAVDDVVARPITEEPLDRFLYSCRVRTTRAPAIVTRLEACLAATAADLVTGRARTSTDRPLRHRLPRAGPARATPRGRSRTTPTATSAFAADRSPGRDAPPLGCGTGIRPPR